MGLVALDLVVHSYVLSIFEGKRLDCFYILFWHFNGDDLMRGQSWKLNVRSDTNSMEDVLIFVSNFHSISEFSDLVECGLSSDENLVHFAVDFEFRSIGECSSLPDLQVDMVACNNKILNEIRQRELFIQYCLERQLEQHILCFPQSSRYLHILAFPTIKLYPLEDGTALFRSFRQFKMSQMQLLFAEFRHMKCNPCA